MSDEKKGTMRQALQWAKDHPKTVSAVGAGVAAAGGAYGAPPEYTTGVFNLLLSLLGLG